MKKIFQFLVMFFVIFLVHQLNAQTAQRDARNISHSPVQPFCNVASTQVLNQIQVDSISDLPAALQTLFGPGVAISNLSYSGDNLAIGIFTDLTSTLGITTGLILTSGRASNAVGPNYTTCASYTNNTPGDSILSVIANQNTFDAAIIAFDFTPLTDTIVGCNFVFGSEEYPEWVGSFNDVFAFMVSGPGFNNLENIALINSTSVPIGINTVNNGPLNTGPCSFCTYYNSNLGGLALQYDGYLIPISLERPVLIGQTYHFKIAIADASDASYDSGVFLEAGSFLGKASLPIAGFNFQVFGDSVSFTNTTNYAKKYVWDFGDGTFDSISLNPVHKYANTGTFVATLHAYNYYQHATISQTISITAAGLEEVRLSADDISILNSGDNMVKITMKGSKSGTVDLYSLTGNLVFSKNISQGSTEEIINLQGFTKGMYTLQVQSGSKVVCKKIVR